MPLAGFGPTIPVFKRAKTFHALDRAATVSCFLPLNQRSQSEALTSKAFVKLLLAAAEEWSHNRYAEFMLFVNRQ
jgi:hypothetical protein